MLIVKKYGGSSVATPERVQNVAKQIIEDVKAGHQIVVVLSAQGKTTDQLIAKAKELNPNPSKREMDMLISTGEQQSVALMAITLQGMGYQAVSLNAFQVPMHTNRTYGNARVKSIETERMVYNRFKYLSAKLIYYFALFKSSLKFFDSLLNIFSLAFLTIQMC